jgi:hypothetical protein
MSIGHSVDDPPPEPQTYVFFRDVPVGGFFLPLPQGCVCTWEKASWGFARLVKSDPGCASPIHSDPGVRRTFAGDDPVKPDTSQSGVWELR